LKESISNFSNAFAVYHTNIVCEHFMFQWMSWMAKCCISWR